MSVRELSVQQYCVAEWAYESPHRYAEPFGDVELDVVLTGPDGEPQRVPAFWTGGQQWRVRFAPSQAGDYHFRTRCSDPDNPVLHGHEGVLHVTPYTGDNLLLRRGPLHVDERGFRHADGTPFFWLGDTWWMGAGKRLGWPDDFQLLAADRKDKGFSVIQLCAAFACGMEPFDTRDVNEAGWAWEKDFVRINPAYFDLLDLRIGWLVRSGLVPCLLGCWGYHLLWMGTARMKQHWRYLIGRYGAYPVVWCLAGEGTMPYYRSQDRDADSNTLREGWTEVARYVRATDPYRHPLSIHPPGRSSGRDSVDDDTLLDVDMLHPGHGGYPKLGRATRLLQDVLNRTPRMPVVNAEVNYEGIWGGSWQDMQRFLFWTTMLSGAAGFTYGATGIWEFNTPNEMFGQFPGHANWGVVPWEESYQYPGSRQVGVGRRILARYQWWRLEPHQEWVEPAASCEDLFAVYCAGIPDGARVCYTPVPHASTSPTTAFFLLRGLESGSRYRASFVDPRTGAEQSIGDVSPQADGTWPCPYPPHMQDWVVVVE